MSEVITFPDTASLVITHLNANLTPSVHGRIPNPRPATFVTVIRTGGPKRNIVTDQAQITVESWAASDVAAMALAQQARGLLNALSGQSISGVPVYRVDELSGPADLPDPLSDQSRCSQSFTVALRGT
jgi:hypothetical protein